MKPLFKFDEFCGQMDPLEILYLFINLSADSFGKLLAFLPGHIDGEILAPLIRHLLALGAGHLLLHLLGYLFTMLFGHLNYNKILGVTGGKFCFLIG